MASRGAQKGNKNAAHDKPWSAAVRRALLANDGQKLRALAEKLVEKALEGDIPAIKEIGDRMEGKPAQAIVGADGGPVTVEIVRFADKPA